MSVYSITFSPTGGTEKAAATLAKALGEEPRQVDLTDAALDFQKVAFGPEDVCLVAVPSFAGRVPATATSRLEQIKGGGAAAVLMTVYGNRAYEDTLVELRDILTKAGFRCVAAVSAVAQHSIVGRFGAGRPDQEDCRELEAFGKKIREKLEGSDAFREPEIPGNRPYKAYGSSAIKPQGDEDCIRCGICAARCPVGAIPVATPAAVDAEKCISCMRCVAICPRGARKVPQELVDALAQRLEKVCQERKNNQLFL